MPSEMEFVTYKQFVENLPSVENTELDDRVVINGSLEGPRTVLSREVSIANNIHVSIDGNNNEIVYKDVNIKYGVECRIIPNALEWEVATNDLGYDIVAFAVYYRDSSNVAHRVTEGIFVNAGDNKLSKPLNNEYRFTIPITAKSAYIGVRAKSGISVSFDVSQVIVVNTAEITNLLCVLNSGNIGLEYLSKPFDHSGKKGLYKFKIESDVDSPSNNLNGMYFRLYNTATSAWVTIIPRGSDSWDIERLIDFDFNTIELKFLKVNAAATYHVMVELESNKDFDFYLDNKINSVNARVDDLPRLAMDKVFSGQNETLVSQDITSSVVKGCSYRLVPSSTTWEVAQNTAGYVYRAFYFRTVKNGVSTNLIELWVESGTSVLNGSLEKEYIVEIPADCDSVVIGFRGKSGVDMTFSLYLSTYAPDMTQIHSMYPYEDVLPKLGTVRKMTPAGYSPKNTPVTLLWFSDMHGDVNNVKRIVEFKNKYDSMIDDVLNTGDSVTDNLGDYSVYQQMLDAGADKFLVAIGNHDVTSSNYTSYKGWSGNTTISDVYDKYVAQMDVQGVVLAGSGKSYYYKDYTSGAVTCKPVRLIVIDSCIQTYALTQSGSGVSSTGTATYMAEQLSWLQNVLADALLNDMAVVCATHGVNAGEEVESRFGFTALVDLLRDDSTIIDEDMLGAVDSFILNGGEFICWLCGHRHCDHIASVSGHSGQVQFVVNTASSRTYTSKTSQPYRTGYNGQQPITKTTDAFDLISFDTYYKVIKIMRIGCNYDGYGRPIDYIAYDYNEKKIIT